MATFPQIVNQQIANEFGASQQYVAIAVYYDAQTLQGLAAHFYRQGVEERNHALMLVQYLLDSGEAVEIPGVEAPQTAFADSTAPVALALAQEKRVTEQIVNLSRVAREEVASMSTLLAIMERAGDNLLLVEDYLARSQVGGSGAGAGAPEAAGGAL